MDEVAEETLDLEGDNKMKASVTSLTRNFASVRTGRANASVLEKIHISIEMFTSKLPEKAISVLDTINHILIAVFGGAMVYYGTLIMDMTKLSTMPATKLPSSVLYVILPLSGLLVLLNAVLVAAKQDKKIFAEGADAGKEETDA